MTVKRVFTAASSPGRPLASESQVAHRVERVRNIRHLDADLALVQFVECRKRVRDRLFACVVILGDPLARRLEISLVARLVARKERESRTEQSQLQVLAQEEGLR